MKWKGSTKKMSHGGSKEIGVKPPLPFIFCIQAPPIKGQGERDVRVGSAHLGPEASDEQEMTRSSCAVRLCSLSLGGCRQTVQRLHTTVSPKQWRELRQRCEGKVFAVGSSCQQADAGTIRSVKGGKERKSGWQKTSKGASFKVSWRVFAITYVQYVQYCAAIDAAAPCSSNIHPQTACTSHGTLPSPLPVHGCPPTSQASSSHLPLKRRIGTADSGPPWPGAPHRCTAPGSPRRPWPLCVHFRDHSSSSSARRSPRPRRGRPAKTPY